MRIEQLPVFSDEAVTRGAGFHVPFVKRRDWYGDTLNRSPTERIAREEATGADHQGDVNVPARVPRIEGDERQGQAAEHQDVVIPERPGRVEPGVVKRRGKQCPCMQGLRAEPRKALMERELPA